METEINSKSDSAFKYIEEVLTRAGCGDSGFRQQENAMSAKVALEDLKEKHAALVLVAEVSRLLIDNWGNSAYCIGVGMKLRDALDKLSAIRSQSEPGATEPTSAYVNQD